MTIRHILYKEFFSHHPDKLFKNHILNMVSEEDNELEKCVKIYHDIAKLKWLFQKYIRTLDEKILGKEHSLLSAYFFMLNSNFGDIETAFGFLAIISHHGSVNNFYDIVANNKNFGRNFEKSIEFNYWDEVAKSAASATTAYLIRFMIVSILRLEGHGDTQ